MSNWFKTTLLLALLTGLLIWIGDMLGGQQGMVMALAFAGVMNFVAYFFSDKIALAMHRAQPVDEASAPQLYAVVAELAQRARIPMPRLYVIPEAQPNAFATGRNPSHAAVAVTEGLMRAMDREELKGVLAHELTHVLNRDILISSIAATIAGALAMLARMAGYAMMFAGRGGDRDDRGGGLGGLFFIIVAPIAALLIQLAISRSREYAADEGGAKLTGSPMGLASALRKLGAYTQRIPMQTAQPTTAHMMIANPFSGGGIMSLFATHPPMEKRIARLEGMIGNM